MLWAVATCVTHLIAFDGSDLPAAALRRAVEFAEAAGTDIVATSVIPADRPLAETYDLVEDGEYDLEAAAERLRSSAHSVAPAVRSVPGGSTPTRGRAASPRSSATSSARSTPTSSSSAARTPAASSSPSPASAVPSLAVPTTMSSSSGRRTDSDCRTPLRCRPHECVRSPRLNGRGSRHEKPDLMSVWSRSTRSRS